MRAFFMSGRDESRPYVADAGDESRPYGGAGSRLNVGVRFIGPVGPGMGGRDESRPYVADASDESRPSARMETTWRSIVAALMLAALLALGTSFAVADDGATGGSAPTTSGGSADTGNGNDTGGGSGGTGGSGGDAGGSGDTGGSGGSDPDPSGGDVVIWDPGSGGGSGGGSDDSHKDDIYDGQIVDYNQGAITLSISMGASYITLEQGQTTTVPCVIYPHQGLLHTELNGTFQYDTTAYSTCSDPSVIRASYDLYSDTLTLEAYAPGTATVTVGANLVYADPVSASITVYVPESLWGEEDESISDGEDDDEGDGNGDDPDDDNHGGVIGGKGDSDTNVTNGTGTSENAHLAQGDSAAANTFEKPAAAAAATSASHPTVTMPEMVVEPEVQEVEEVPEVTEVEPTIKLYELEEVQTLLNQNLPSKLPFGFILGVALAAAAFVVFGGGETYMSFRRRLA